jgi:hypothetical protein
MGELAEDMIDGTMCSWCGVYFEQSHGFEVACDSCWEDACKSVTKKDEEVKRDAHGKILMINGVQKHINKEL